MFVKVRGTFTASVSGIMTPMREDGSAPVRARLLDRTKLLILERSQEILEATQHG